MWRAGVSGNPKGRKPGPTRKTVEVRELCKRLFDTAYWRLKWQRLHDGTEHPKIEIELLRYAYGPAQTYRDLERQELHVHTGMLEDIPRHPLSEEQIHEEQREATKVLAMVPATATSGVTGPSDRKLK